MAKLGQTVGKVFLVGAGPGDPDLVTVRGTQVLATVDLVLHDYLINPELLRYAPKSADVVGLGHPHSGRSLPQDQINARMIAAARSGKTVVRLKCGDPSLFGRGAEEAEALSRAGIAYEVVPGVTAALAAAGLAGVPITHRGMASAVAFVTGHECTNRPHNDLDYDELARFPGTLVFYMGITSAARWSTALLRGGKPPDTAVAIVRRASWPDQEIIRCRLGEIVAVIEREEILPPAVIFVGRTAGLGGAWTREGMA